MREAVRKANHPDDLFSLRKLRKLWEIYEEELGEWLRRGEEEARKGSIVYILVEGVKTRKLRSPLSTILSDRFPDKVFIVGQRSNGYVEYSLRCQNYEKRGVHLGEIAREAAKLFGGRGGGHPPAAGLKIPVEKEEEFRRWVREVLS